MKYTGTITFDFTITDTEKLATLGEQVVNYFGNPVSLVLKRDDYYKFADTEELEQTLEFAMEDIPGVTDVQVSFIQ